MGHSFFTPDTASWPSKQSLRRQSDPADATARLRNLRPGTAANECKITVEVAGNDLESCGCGHILAAAVKDAAGRVVDHQKARALADAGQTSHRQEVELGGLTRKRRHLYIKTGCHEASDGACLIPLQRDARPVPADTQESIWPTVLIPVVPMAYGDENKSRAKARRLRNGWLYIYVNDHLWRELYVTKHGVLRDVNLGLPHVAGSDVREPSGHAMSAVLVPHTIDGRKQKVQMAFAEVQWSWHTVCAMGGPADDDMRFLPRVIAAARRIEVDARRRLHRFITLDFSGYPQSLNSPDGLVGSIESAPGMHIPVGDPLAAMRHKKIAAVYLQDPLLIARNLAVQYQQSWRDMQNLLQKLARAPRTSLKEKTYEPGRWFDAAVLANHYFFGPFPDFASWQKLHPAADQQDWQKAKAQHTRMQACLDKRAIGQALGARQRQEARLIIEKSRQRLVEFLQARTKKELDLLVLMLDDYFTLPNTTGKIHIPGRNPCGYVDGWGVVEQLIARLGDHSFTLDLDLEAEPVDMARLMRDNSGMAFLNTLADPDRRHPLHARLFPRPAADPLMPDITPADGHGAAFKPQNFQSARLADMAPVAGFVSHFAKSAITASHPRIRHSLTRLVNATCRLTLQQVRINGEALERHAVAHQRPLEQKQADLQSASEGSLADHRLADLMRSWFLFAKPAASRDAQAADGATGGPPGVNAAGRPKKPQACAPLRWRLSDADLKDWEVDQMVSVRSARVKKPLPDSDYGYISFPQSGPETQLQIVTPPGEIIGRSTIADFRQGKAGPGQVSARHRRKYWYRTEAELLISRDPDLLVRLCRLLKKKELAKQVIIPLAIVFESWNLHILFCTMIETIGCDALIKSIGHTIGALFDFSSISTALLFQRIGAPTESTAEIVQSSHHETPPGQWTTPAWSGSCERMLGVAAGSFSASLSVRDLLIGLRRIDPSNAARGILLPNWFLGAAYDIIWTAGFIAGATAETACPPTWATAEGPLMWIGLGAVLAPLSLLIFVSGDNSPLEQWLTHGPFSHTGSCARFGGHRPGDTDWGPPRGGAQRRQVYPGTIREMTFWKEPDGSFLWIDDNGLIVDSKIVPGGRLYLEGYTIYLQTAQGKIVLGPKGGPIQNRNRLPVDRKDNGNRLRRWCEQPVQAYHALAALLFTPKVEMEFSRWPCADTKYPTANPFWGWDYFVHVHIVLPHFVEDKSRLYVELWETVDGKPRLAYDARITIALDESIGMRQLTLTWPLAKVYCRRTEVNAKVKLDLFGDGRLCLPINNRQEKENHDWIIKSRQVEREPVTLNADYYGYR